MSLCFNCYCGVRICIKYDWYRIDPIIPRNIFGNLGVPISQQFINIGIFCKRVDLLASLISSERDFVAFVGMVLGCCFELLGSSNLVDHWDFRVHHCQTEVGFLFLISQQSDCILIFVSGPVIQRQTENKWLPNVFLKVSNIYLCFQKKSRDK